MNKVKRHVVVVAPTQAEIIVALEEKQRLIKQQLLALLHAHKCQSKDDEARRQQGSSGIGTFTSACTLHACAVMKGVLAHMKNCQLRNKSCATTHCFASRQILTHWKICVNPNCPVCGELKSGRANRANQAQTPEEQPLPENPKNDDEDDVAGSLADLKLEKIE